MGFSSRFATIFGVLGKTVGETETHKSYELVFNSDSINIPSENQIDILLKEYCKSTYAIIHVVFDGNDPVSFSSKDNNIRLFLEELDNAIVASEPEEIKIEVKLYKEVAGNTVCIYSYRPFERFLLSMSALDFLSFLSDLNFENDVLIFSLYDETEEFYSSSIFFVRNGNETELVNNYTNRTKTFEQIKSVCHYGNSSNYRFLPTDFKLIKKNDDLSELNLFFDQMSLLHCLICLFDITSINDNVLSYKLNGFKSISGNLSLPMANTSSLEEYFNIYTWTYEGGNLSDKVGLVRNIISIHINEGNIVKLKGSPLVSAKSSFEIYLKQNIKQYIEIRNKISEQLIDFSKRANTIVEAFAINFQRSIFTFLSFFTSVFVLRFLSKGELNNILTPEATIISLGFLVVAVIYLVYSTWEINVQKNRFEQSYNNMKLRYKDLLLEDDITRILNHDQDHKCDLKFIKEKKAKYMQMWIITLVIFLLIIAALYSIANNPFIFLRAIIN